MAAEQTEKVKSIQEETWRAWAGLYCRRWKAFCHSAPESAGICYFETGRKSTFDAFYGQRAASFPEETQRQLLYLMRGALAPSPSQPYQKQQQQWQERGGQDGAG